MKTVGLLLPTNKQLY